MKEELFTKLTKMGYLIHNKRVIGNPSFTSESTRNRDLCMELSLINEWLRTEFNVWIVVNFTNRNMWYFECKKVGFANGEEFLYKSNYDYNYPQDAYIGAANYALDKLTENMKKLELLKNGLIKII